MAPLPLKRRPLAPAVGAFQQVMRYARERWSKASVAFERALCGALLDSVWNVFVVVACAVGLRAFARERWPKASVAFERVLCGAPFVSFWVVFFVF